MRRPSIIGAKALIANPALKRLAFLIGEWRTTGTHPLVSGETLRGRTCFAWHEGGGFLIMRSQVDHPQFPDGMAIIASDDAAGAFAMSYFDERGTSRLFDVTVGELTVTWRRDHPKFAQSTTITADGRGGRLVGKGRMSQDGGPWTDDLSQVFERETAPLSIGRLD
jgi:hypothetical protein